MDDKDDKNDKELRAVLLEASLDEEVVEQVLELASMLGLTMQVNKVPLAVGLFSMKVFLAMTVTDVSENDASYTINKKHCLDALATILDATYKDLKKERASAPADATKH